MWGAVTLYSSHSFLVGVVSTDFFFVSISRLSGGFFFPPKNVDTLKSETETGSPKHVFFIIGVTVRLQSRDIQVIDSDTHLCTQLFTAF